MVLILYGTSIVTVWWRHLFITGSGLIVRGGRRVVFPPDNGRFWILSSHRVVARTKSNLFGRVRTRWTTSSRERVGKKVKRREEQPRVINRARSCYFTASPLMSRPLTKDHNIVMYVQVLKSEVVCPSARICSCSSIRKSKGNQSISTYTHATRMYKR
jgi:hypothetical protein